MKRLTLALLAILMVFCVIFAACENDSEESVTDSSANESVSESVSESSASSTDKEASDESIDHSADESTEDYESMDESVDESKEQSEQVSSDTSDVSTDESIAEINVKFSRYTQQPRFVMIGTCAMDATVTAEYNGQSVSVPSYMGWFELTLENKNNETFLDITFSQEIAGESYGEKIIKVKPSVPQNLGTRAIGSNKAFQFFLEQMVPDFQGNNLFGSSNIDSMKERVSTHLARMHKYNRDAEIIYMIVPSPMTTYPELVPDYYKKGTGMTRYEQVKQGLTEAGATVIDLRETFNEHKNDEMPLYYKLDSHWADYGAYLAYVELFEHISKKFPKAAPRGIDEFSWTADYYTSADACLYLGIPQIEVKEYGYYREFDFPDPSNILSVPRYRGMQLIYNDLTTEEKIFNNNNRELPSCIVYRDSYCAGIYDILAERMNRTHYMGMWSYAWQNYLIDSEKPDYVIYILTEWNMHEVVYN